MSLPSPRFYLHLGVHESNEKFQKCSRRRSQFSLHGYLVFENPSINAFRQLLSQIGEDYHHSYMYWALSSIHSSQIGHDALSFSHRNTNASWVSSCLMSFVWGILSHQIAIGIDCMLSAKLRKSMDQRQTPTKELPFSTVRNTHC